MTAVLVADLIESGKWSLDDPLAMHLPPGTPVPRQGERQILLRDVGTFTDPHHYPEGIPWVLVNGEPVIANGSLTSARPGRVLRHEPK